MTPLENLNAQWSRPPHVRFEERWGGPVAVLSAGGATAAVAIQGAQVLSWQPQQTGEVLWLSPSAQLGTGKAVRGGIPVCWPWFGPCAQGGAGPPHGFVRAAAWTLETADGTTQRSSIRLAFDASHIDPQIWPHQARASLEVVLSETLQLSLTTENRGPGPFLLGEALHTYLRVGDIAGVAIEGLDGRCYIDQLAEAAARPVQAGAITIDREVDRIYLGAPGTVTVRDKNLRREIRIAKSGSRATVVWNPWVQKSARLGDMGQDGYRRMVCVETANTADECITLAPGERHVLVATLEVRSS